MTSLPKPTPPTRRSLLRELFADNPMLDEAIRARRRFRRGGASAGPALYYAVIGLIVLAYVWSIVAIIHSQSNVTEEMCYFELIIVTLAMPLSLYATIAGEREKATWEALVLTRLTPGQILAGKLTWRITTLLTLLLILLLQIIIGEAIHPVFGFLGTLYGQLLVFTWGIFLGALTLFVSTISKRSVAALGITGITLVVTLLLFPMLVSIFGFGPAAYNYPAGAFNLLSWQAFTNYSFHLNPFVALDKVVHGPPAAILNGFDYSSGGDYDSFENRFLYFTKFVPIAPVAFIALALSFMALAYRILRKLEAPQETERDYRKRFRNEIAPHVGIGVITAVAFCILTYKISDGDIALIVVTTLVGLVLGSFCAWLVSRGGKVIQTNSRPRRV